MEAIAEIDAGYKKALKNPDKFCRGYGMFQYDLQFFEKDPDFFLKRKWAKFDGTLEKWPAPGSEDTELGVLMELEVDHGEAEVYA